jgi:hypothetical protein
VDIKVWPGLFSADATSVNEQRFGNRIKVDIMAGGKSIDKIWFHAPHGYQFCSLEPAKREDGKQHLMIYSEESDEVNGNDEEDEDENEDEDLYETTLKWSELWKSKR